MCLPWNHPMHQAFQPAPLLGDANLVIVVENDVPWIPSREHPPADCPVAHLGADPSFARYPMRSYRNDLAIAADLPATLAALDQALGRLTSAEDAKIAARRRRLAARAREIRRARAAEGARHGAAAVITPQWVSRGLCHAPPGGAIALNEDRPRL